MPAWLSVILEIVKITVPADHIMEATGDLQNEKKVLTREQRRRYEKARNSFKDPVMIVTQAEAEEAEKTAAAPAKKKAKKKRTKKKATKTAAS